MRLAKKVFINLKEDAIEEKIMVQFVNGLFNNTVRQRIETDGASGMYELINKAVYFENNLNKFKTATNTNTKTTGQNNLNQTAQSYINPRVEYNNNQANRRANAFEYNSQATREKPNCYGCNSTEHVRRDCPTNHSRYQQYGQQNTSYGYQGNKNNMYFTQNQAYNPSL